jgi:hypothetical protein
VTFLKAVEIIKNKIWNTLGLYNLGTSFLDYSYLAYWVSDFLTSELKFKPFME